MGREVCRRPEHVLGRGTRRRWPQRHTFALLRALASFASLITVDHHHPALKKAAPPSDCSGAHSTDPVGIETPP